MVSHGTTLEAKKKIDTSGSSADVLCVGGSIQGDGFETLGVIRTGRTADDEEEGFGWWLNSERAVGTDLDL